MMSRTLTAATLAAIAAVPTGALWAAGEYRHRRDNHFCTFGGVEARPGPATWGTAPPPPPPQSAAQASTSPRSSKRYVDSSCVTRREARRWGPFLVFGDMPRDRED
jgi:hypothetical protein